MNSKLRFSPIFQLIALIILFFPDHAHAYIGPGAGFAFLGSTFVFMITILMLVVTISLWPLQWAWRKMRGFGISKNARTRRVVILGLDGLEPTLTEKFMQEGKLPNLKKLAESGSYSRLGTTLPALSPVAWSTFQTGVNPGSHNIFDFLTRDKRHCMPLLSSTTTIPARRIIKLGKFQFALDKPKIQIMRKSVPFWKILGGYGVFSNILRIPISYPPEKFYGNIISAMCTPDIKGTQGTFAFFTTKPIQDHSSGDGTTGGQFFHLEKNGEKLFGFLSGPANPKSSAGESLIVKFSLTPAANGENVLFECDGEKQTLKLNEFSPWMTVEFKLGKRKGISGIYKVCLRDIGEYVSLYVSPININPEKPALPIAAPIIFSSWLAKKQGLFGTLGLMEDTWGRNELALDDQRFLDQTYHIHDERERMFMEALSKTKQGVCACVFDASDRIQHMFWRYLDDKHPSPLEDVAKFKNVIPEMYEKMDKLVGKVQEQVKPGDAFIVLSDHGFSSFRRGINLNTWLYQNGYLAVKNDMVTGSDYFQDVDWSKTKAFALGLSGIYINRKGRERQGIVEDVDFENLKNEIAAKLEAVADPQDGSIAIRKMYHSNKVYRGLYASEAPDMITGYAPGYRVSWDSVTGMIEKDVFSDNLKAWSGDHHVDPKAVPGIFFSNMKLKSEAPHLVDLAPTILDLFAVPAPKYMEGGVIL